MDTIETATLREIWIYPIKSTQGISLTQAEVEGAGLAYDRRWMVVAPDGHFMTAREHPRLLQVATTINDTTLELRDTGASTEAPLSLPLAPPVDSLDVLEVTIWGMTHTARDMGDDAAAWFFALMETPCRLVWMPEPRAVRPDFADVGDGTVSFGDALPCLIVSQASLDDLNQRASEPVGMERFRPNLVVDGCPPFDEDQWASFTIGDVSFAGVKLCDRCSLTTIDPASGTKGKEPLATLATYRKHAQRVYFGQNAIPQGTGQVVVGQTLKVHSRATLLTFGED